MLEQLAGFAVTPIAFVVVLTVLVFVHEMGHYLVARWYGVRVEVFSIGFGPELFGWTDRHATRWKVSAIPLGGYVKFFGDADAASAPGETSSLSEAERAVAFHCKSLKARAAIVAAGPLANFAYAIVVLTILFTVVGERVTQPVIGRVLPDSPAAAAGFERGDRVLAIDGDTVRRFEDVDEAGVINPGRRLVFTVERDGAPLELAVVPEERVPSNPDAPLRKYGYLGLGPANPAEVGAVMADGAAAEAGLRPGDRIVAVDGRPVGYFEDVQDLVGASAGAPLRVTVEGEDGRRRDVALQARRHVYTDRAGGEVERWLIGVTRPSQPLVRYGPGVSFLEAVRASGDMVVKTVAYLGEMVRGERGTEELGGPIRIAQVSGQAARVGLESLIKLSVLLSLNLGLINLFPIPMLDGGHLAFYAYEAVRGRPPTERVMEFAFRVGLVLLVSLMVFVTVNDLIYG